MSSFQDLFEEHAAIALEKQWALSEFLGEHEWSLDLEDGIIMFNQEHRFPVQVLGTESEYSHTWLWAWANTQSSTPAHLLTATRQLSDFGKRHKIPEFTQAQHDLDRLTGHQLALVASSMCQADCYYRGPYDGGAVFVLIDAPVIRRLLTNVPLRMIEVFRQLISLFPLNHRRAFLAYCIRKGYTCKEQGQKILAQDTTGLRLRASFDAMDRVAELKTTVEG